MSFSALNLLMDIVVLGGLGVTLFYVFRLSNSLNVFKQTRQDMGRVMDELARNIEKAQQAIEKLKSSSAETAEILKRDIREANALVDELQLMNEAGNGLATRLERLAERGSRKAQGLPELPMEEEGPARPPRYSNTSEPAFDIQDRDFGLGDEDDEMMAEELMSQAEKELFMALRGGKNR